MIQHEATLRAPAAVNAFVALGANLGDAAQALSQAVVSLNQLPWTQVLRCSSVYKTQAIGAIDATVAMGTGVPDPLTAESMDSWDAASFSPDYLNAVVELQTELTAPALLAQLQQVELAAGRERPYRNAPRTLDLDLLLYGEAKIDSVELTVPHPRMNERAFVLVPLAEIAAQLVRPAMLDLVSAQVIERLDSVQISSHEESPGRV